MEKTICSLVSIHNNWAPMVPTWAQKVIAWSFAEAPSAGILNKQLLIWSTLPLWFSFFFFFFVHFFGLEWIQMIALKSLKRLKQPKMTKIPLKRLEWAIKSSKYPFGITGMANILLNHQNYQNTPKITKCPKKKPLKSLNRPK